MGKKLGNSLPENLLRVKAKADGRREMKNIDNSGLAWLIERAFRLIARRCRRFAGFLPHASP
jgi:hypothetical protein